MAVEAIVTPLLNVELFQGLQPLHLAKLAHIAERIVYRPGDLLIREGEAGDASILIVSGEATRIGGPLDGHDDEAVPQHALVGEMAMLIDTEHTSTVVARDQVRALRIPREALNALMQEHPVMADHFVAKLAARLDRIALELRRAEAHLSGDEPEQMPEPMPAARQLPSPAAHAAAMAAVH